MSSERQPVPSVEAPEAPVESLALDQQLEQMGQPELARYVREAQERRRQSIGGHVARLLSKRGRSDEDNHS